MRRSLPAPLLAAALLLAAPAHAEVWSGTDEAGDVRGFTFDREPRPCGTVTRHDGSAETHGDLLRASVQHGRERLRITTRYEDLLPGRGLFVSHEIRTHGRDFVAWVTRFPGGPTGTWWYDAAVESTDSCGSTSGAIMVGDGPTCRGLDESVSPRRDRVRLTVPTDCLDSPRWVRVNAAVSQHRDEITYGDRWGEAGRRWSPRVRPGRR